MKVLALTRYERLGASSRVRFLQFLPFLKKSGIEVSVSALFSNYYVEQLQLGRKPIFDISNSFIKRIIIILKTKNIDVLWIEKDCLPWIPYWLECILLSKFKCIVIDYDDAVFHFYEDHKNFIIRKLLTNKHRNLIRNASLVIVGNSYLENYAEKAGAKTICLLPTVIDIERYPENNFLHNDNSKLLKVGWIGNYGTAKYLKPLSQVFKRISNESYAQFIAIGIDPIQLDLPMLGVPWSESSEVESLGGLDVGIMPLPNETFEKGKCGYKLIQYMACSLPVIASPVGVNNDIVKDGINGFLVQSEEEWYQAINMLLSNFSLRQRMGRSGREMVLRNYCTKIIEPKLVVALEKAFASRVIVP